MVYQPRNKVASNPCPAASQASALGLTHSFRRGRFRRWQQNTSWSQTMLEPKWLRKTDRYYPKAKPLISFQENATQIDNHSYKYVPWGQDKRKHHRTSTSPVLTQAYQARPEEIALFTSHLDGGSLHDFRKGCTEHRCLLCDRCLSMAYIVPSLELESNAHFFPGSLAMGCSVGVVSDG